MPERVLVVDDEEVVLDAVRKALRHDDLEIDAAQSGAGALGLLASRPYDLVITDLMMPGVDGLGLLQRIREMDLHPQTIMITGYPTIQTALRAKRLGAFEYVTKPFTGQELRSVVVRALRTPRAAEGSPAPVESSAPVWYIPNHAWVRFEPDGSARVGVASVFAAAAGLIVNAKVPAAGDLVEQGRACALILASDAVEHSVYSPLSGRVLEINQAAIDDPRLIQSSPEQAGWLFRLLPTNADKELPDLVRR
jgi:CheY-like chemotaxis protein/glycine cleavage system H lipoate-binding protein